MSQITPIFGFPIKQMPFNEKKGWWECPLFGVEYKPVVVWLEPSYEEKRIYFNIFLQKDDTLDNRISRLVSATLFPLHWGSISTDHEADSCRLFFDLGRRVFNEEILEQALSSPILLYIQDCLSLPAWYIPYRPKPKKQEELSEGERIAREKRMQEAYAEWLMQRELQEKQVQEQKEQTEKEWEEWEKRQSEENDK